MNTHGTKHTAARKTAVAGAGLLLLTTSVNAAKIYVSPAGHDGNDGSKDAPFATLERARDAVRDVRGRHAGGMPTNEAATNGAPTNGAATKGAPTNEAATNGHEEVTVWIAGGTYVLERPLVLEPQDSHTSYRAMPGETPVITGGRVIAGWQPLKEELPAMTAEAQGNLWFAEIPEGWRFHYLFVNGQRAERSKSTDVPWRQWPKDYTFGEPEKQGQMITFKKKEQLRHIPSNGDAELVVIVRQYGVMGNGVITDVDPDAGTLRWNSKQLNVRSSRNSYETGYRFENALCWIDRPGEWAVDSSKGRVYYWPVDGDDMTTAHVIAPELYELVRLQGIGQEGPFVENVQLHGLTFAYTDRLPENQWPDEWIVRQWENPGATLFMEGTKDCVVMDCRFLHNGSYGITMRFTAQRNRIEGCQIGWTGSGGIFLEGYGPGTIDVNTHNVITRNHIHDHGLGNYWHSPSIQIYQSGHNVISYNLLQRAAYSSISMVGIRYSYMHDPRYTNKEIREGQYHPWNAFRIPLASFPQEIQDGLANGTYRFNRDSIKPYLHVRNNIIEYNVISEPHTILNEGGAIYAWGIGKDNVWRKNAIFKSRGMPDSSILALDDEAEYTTVQDNVFWIEGPILDGVGARANERGITASGNVRVNYKPEFKARRGHDKIGPGRWWTQDPGREPLDNLLKEITGFVEQHGGWLGNPPIGIPHPGEPITKYGEQLITPPGANVTIEE